MMLCFLAVHAGLGDTRNVIHIAIDGLHSDNGQVICSLYSSSDGFPKQSEKAIAHAKAAITNRHAECSFGDTQPGTYAVSVFHDENSNGRLDSNFLGIPREGVGASNNAKGHFGPPSFRDASFAYSGSHMDLKIMISYL